LYKIIKILFEKFIPDRFYLITVLIFNRIRESHEYELFAMQKFLKKKRRFIDIGGNRGIYSFFYSSHFKKIECFEPIKEITNKLASSRKKNISIHNIGLSDKNAQKILYIPYIKKTLATPLASLNKPVKTEYLERKINIKALDDFKFKDVDFIKIDVEGNELNVIKGSIKTIEKYKPILLIEIEQRHNQENIESIFNFIKSLGYDGFFFKNKIKESLDKFNYEIDQKKYLKNPDSKKYINNFFFIPNKKKD